MSLANQLKKKSGKGTSYRAERKKYTKNEMIISNEYYSSKTVTLILGLVLLALRDEFDFDEEKTKRVMDKANEIAVDVREGYLTVEDIRETLWDEVHARI